MYQNTTQNKGIKRNQYIVPSTDVRGHSVSLSFRVMPTMAREIEELMQTRDQFGWKTTTDFLRYAVWKTLGEVIPEVGNVSLNNLHQQSAYASALLVTRQETLRFNKMFEETDTTVREHNAAGRQDIARDTLNELLGYIEAMQGTEWKKHYMAEFRRRFTGVCTKLKISLKLSDQYHDPNEELPEPPPDWGDNA